jgi:hypothetical protein
MSNFACDKCGAICCDSPAGYTTGCEHYPPDLKQQPKIKPLVWCWVEDHLYIAHTPVGEFKAWRPTSFSAWRANDDHRVFPSKEEAQEYLKQIYERRVRECLE